MGWVVSVTPLPCFTPRETTPGTHWIRGWVDPRVGLDTEGRGKIICLCWWWNPDCLVVRSIVILTELPPAPARCVQFLTYFQCIFHRILTLFPYLYWIIVIFLFGFNSIRPRPISQENYIAFIRHKSLKSYQYCNVLGLFYSRWNFIALQKSIHYS
jgi:hypothetical protein